MKAIKINQRNWKQARSIVITTRGLYNFNGTSNKRFVEAGKIRGVIYSTKTYEMIIHIPSEYDYHYNINEHMEKLIYYLYLSKQLNSKTPAELFLIKTDIEFLGAYAVKEQQKKEDDFKRLEGVSYTKELYKSKIKFELFTDAFKYYVHKTGTEVFNMMTAFPSPGDNPSEFDVKMIEPILVLSSSKIGRVLLVQNKQTKNKYALKYFYRWKLVKFGEDEKLLALIHKLNRYVGCSSHP
jgi:serum/glucocorticoid-regulated kinase 2